MKILVAYDGSQCAKDAIQDLRNAGLPNEGAQATVLSAGEVRSHSEVNLEPGLSIAAYGYEHTQEILSYALEAAEHDAEEGKTEIQKLFPQWEVTPCSRISSPASTILEIEESWKPDLIVMGSHGRGALGRIFLGSVSLRVASEAHTSVRITHPVSQTARTHACTILLAFDGSKGSRKAVHQILKRSWPLSTKLHIVSVIDVSILATPEYIWLVGSDVGQYQEMKESRIEHVLHSLEEEMKKRFTRVTTSTPIGTPVQAILAEAKRVGADTIFVGTRGLSRLERVLLGSVAHGIAVHAEATVEIAR